MLSFTRRTERKLRDRNSQLVVPNKSFARVRVVCEQQLQQMRQPLQKPNQLSKPVPTPARVSLPSKLQACMCSVPANLHVLSAARPGLALCRQICPRSVPIEADLHLIFFGVAVRHSM